MDRDSNVSHAVWSYDFETSARSDSFRRRDNRRRSHVIADFVPDGSHVICVAGAAPGIRSPTSRDVKAKPQPSSGGIWIGSTDGSRLVARCRIDRRTARSRFPRPFRPDRRAGPSAPRWAARSPSSASKPVKKIRSRTASSFAAGIADRKVERAYESTGDLLDLHWSPDGSQLGFVATDPTPTLKVVDLHGRAASTASRLLRARISRDGTAAGDKLACVVAEKMPPKAPESWALLLLPDPLARDSILLADAHGSRHTVASGLRFTFPQWSSKRDQLSVWGTFSPSHRSLASELWGSGLGLRRGDPAAVVDASTGAIRWLAINGDELAQIGHFFLLKHDDAQAREWYRKADKQLPKLEPLRPADLVRGLSGAAARRRTFEIFYWYCLTKLGEPNEAAARLATFDNAHRIEWPPTADRPAPVSRPENAAPDGSKDARNRPRATRHLPGPRVQARHDAETSRFDLEGPFDRPSVLERRRPRRSTGLVQPPTRIGRRSGPARRLDGAVAALPAAEGRTETMRPSSPTNSRHFSRRRSRIPPKRKATRWMTAQRRCGFAVPLLAAHAVGPLFCDGFLKELPTEFVSQLVPKWEALRGRCHSQFAALCVDLFLRAAAAVSVTKRNGSPRPPAFSRTRFTRN